MTKKKEKMVDILKETTDKMGEDYGRMEDERLAKVTQGFSKMTKEKSFQLSYTRIRRFTTCPYAAHLWYKKGIRPIKINARMVLGKAIHDTLDYYYNPDLKTTVKEAIRYFIATWNGACAEESIDFGTTRITRAMVKENPKLEYGSDKPLTSKDWEKEGLGMLTAYFKSYYEEDWEVKEGEKEFLIPKLNLAGRIDLIASDEEGILYLIDHKTLARQAKVENFREDNQLLVYYLGAKEMGYKIDKMMLNILYRKKVPTVERIVFDPPSERAIKEFKEDSKEIEEDLERDRKYKRKGFHCQSCDLKDYCYKNEGYKSKFYTEKWEEKK